jgi:hypothetical protein
MRRVMRIIGFLLIALAVAAVLMAWWTEWQQYREEVRVHRFVWGPHAEVKAFNPLRLVGVGMHLDSASWYILTAGFGVPGLLLLLLAPPKRSVGKQEFV